MNKKTIGSLVVVGSLSAYLINKRVKKNKDTSRIEVKEYVISDLNDAQEVIEKMKEAAELYYSVSIGDYYDLLGVMQRYTDNNHGWGPKEIKKARVVALDRGYIIKFPPVKEI